MRQPRTPPSRGRGSVADEGLRSRSTKVILTQQKNSDGPSPGHHPATPPLCTARGTGLPVPHAALTPPTSTCSRRCRRAPLLLMRSSLCLLLSSFPMALHQALCLLPFTPGHLGRYSSIASLLRLCKLARTRPHSHHTRRPLVRHGPCGAPRSPRSRRGCYSRRQATSRSRRSW